MSAFVIDSKLYKKLADILQAIANNPILSSELMHPIQYFGRYHLHLNPESLKFREESVKQFVVEMIRLNYESVGYRYREPEHSIEMFEDMSLICPKANNTFIVYGKPQDYLEIARFLDCWYYQSCEKDDHHLSDKDKALFKAVEALKGNLLQYGLEKATGSKGSWGHLELTFDKKTTEVQAL